MSVTFFNVTANYSAFVASGLLLNGDVLFKPVFHVGDIAKATGLSTPTGFVPVQVHARLANGVLQAVDGSTLQLQSATSDLNLVSPLYYSVVFSNLVASTPHPSIPTLTTSATGFEIRSFAFLAPVDATAVNLIAVSPVAGTTNAVGIGVVTTPPATAGAAGFAGQLAYDSGFVYVCVALNTWKRAAIASW